MHRRGASRFCRNFLSHRTEKFRKGILLFLRKFLVSKCFMDENGGYHVFPSKFFGFTVPKNFVEEPVCVSENFGYRKTLCLRGEYHDFL